MIKRIIKRDGSTERFDILKPGNWLRYSSKELNLDLIDISSILIEACQIGKEEMNSQDFQKLLITVALSRGTYTSNRLAGKLYACYIHKNIFPEGIPTVSEYIKKLQGLGLIDKMPYTEEEYEAINEFIDHERDKVMPYYSLQHILVKYALGDSETKTVYETPQFACMRMALELSSKEDPSVRLEEVRNFYDELSFGRINAPTPNWRNLGTFSKGLASCCLYAVEDTARSIAIGHTIVETMTYMSAGIGGKSMIRSIGDKVRNGAFLHQGKQPYQVATRALTKANLQGSRGGASTDYIDVYDPEIRTMVMYQNPRTPEDKRIRGMHFAVIMNPFFIKKALEGKDIFYFNCKTAPDLYMAFSEGREDDFVALYEEYEKDPNFVKKWDNARELLVLIGTQNWEVSTVYAFNITEANKHTSFKEPIHSSNLCVAPETTLLTDTGDKTISDLVGQKVTIWNGKEWSKNVEVVKTGINQKLLTVTTSNGRSLDCTGYHKWHVIEDGEEVILRTFQLQPGMVLLDLEQSDSTISYTDVEVVSIEDKGHISDTYCVTEPLRNMAVFNGILTGQCTEITNITKPYKNMVDLYTEDHHNGEVGLCSLAGIVYTRIKEDDDLQYLKTAKYALKMIDYCIHNSYYELPHIGYTAKQRLNAAVGLLDVANHMAKKYLPYDCQAGFQELHKIAERHSYFLIRAALELGKERGNAPWIDKTKWPEGWTPIETYNKNVDTIAPFKLYYDWKELSQEIIKNKGIRFSSLVAHMPTESSSKAAFAMNGPYMARMLTMVKTDGTNAIDWVAPGSDEYGAGYQLAWTTSVVDQFKIYAIFQKFADQSISADVYRDRRENFEIKHSDILDEYAAMFYYGVKSRYYNNTLSVDATNEDSEIAAAFGEVIENTLSLGNGGAACGSGGCTL